MNENSLISVIKNVTQSSFIGDDCAFLPELGITVSQDSLVEDVHFNLDWMTPFDLGVKALKVNLSDILASGAEPAYALISLSLPKNISEDFVKEFYEGVKAAQVEVLEMCKSANNFQVVGGDITGSDKVFISICVIGKVNGRNISSRSNAKVGYNVAVCGYHGMSAAGLELLKNGKYLPENLVKAHKSPNLYPDFALNFSSKITTPYAMMDTSDGLADALFKIAKASDVTINIDFNKIPVSPNLKIFDNWERLLLFGGEDYGLVFAYDKSFEPDFSLPEFNVVGEVLSKSEYPLVIKNNDKILKYSTIDEFTFNHFS